MKPAISVASAAIVSLLGTYMAAAPVRAEGVLLQQPTNAAYAAMPGIPSCTSVATLRGDLAKSASTLMVRMSPGCSVPMHWHTPTEEIVVLQGKPLAQMDKGPPVVLQVGSYSQLPSHHLHRFRCVSKEACIIFLVADAAFDVHYVNAKGAEIPVSDALKAAASDTTKW